MTENDLSRTPTKARENYLSYLCETGYLQWAERSDSHVWYARKIYTYFVDSDIGCQYVDLTIIDDHHAMNNQCFE